MEFKKLFTKKGVLFLGLFALLSLVGMNINFSALVGKENQFFTLFQLFGPTAGMFLGPVVGAASVLIAQLSNFFIAGTQFSMLSLLRILPMLFAAYYFGTKRKSFGIAVSLIAIAAFIAHPLGKQVWYFSLFWTVPLIAAVLPKKYSEGVMAKSLGSTFAAHAVGGAIWIWSVPMTVEAYIALIPVVLVERLLFASGIAVSYVTLNAVLDKALEKMKVKAESFVEIRKKFTFRA
ncbi:hypothetical protein J4212_03935 [Candidatus Woesearchaeota archaeon]|nr:hypothetical protein [Candidatus Woesearchaeota archaeon]